MLMIAPTSYPSIRFIPTANPAITAPAHADLMDLDDSAANARKIIPADIFQAPKPQQAVEKKCMFSPAAIPPNTQTAGLNSSWRNKTQALNPTKNNVKGP